MLQLDEVVVAHQAREGSGHVLEDILRVEGLDVPITRRVKPDQNSHHFRFGIIVPFSKQGKLIIAVYTIYLIPPSLQTFGTKRWTMDDRSLLKSSFLELPLMNLGII